MACLYSVSASAHRHSFCSALASTTWASTSSGSSSNAFLAAASTFGRVSRGDAPIKTVPKSLRNPQARKGRSEGLLPMNRVLKMRDSFLEPDWAVLVQGEAALEITLVNLRRHCTGCHQPPALLPGNGHLDLSSDGLRYLALQLQHVPQFTIERASPQVHIGFTLNELRSDANPIARANHRALHHRTDVQFSGDLWHRTACALKLHRRCARNDLQTLHRQNPPDQPFLDAIAKQ